MPVLELEELERASRLRALVMGRPKHGKTASVIMSAPGPVAVALCEDDTALNEVKRQCATANKKKHALVIPTKGGWNSAIGMLKDIRELVTAKRVETVVIDPITDLAYRMEQELLKEMNNDGRRVYPIYLNRLMQILDNLFSLDVHIIAIAHYLECESEKSGKGVMPLLAGKAAEKVAAKFTDVLWMEIRDSETQIPPDGDGHRRIFVTGPEGAWGPGCRSLAGTYIIPANVGGFIDLATGKAKVPEKMKVEKFSTAGGNGSGIASAKTPGSTAARVPPPPPKRPS